MSLPAIPAATSITPAQIDGVCTEIETWADEVDDVHAIRDAASRLAAIDLYLNRTSSEGRARVSASLRRLEVRVGQLLGPAPSPHETGGQKGSPANEPSPLTPNQRSDFRNMASNEDVVEEIIAASTDEAPASRRAVLGAIKTKQPKPDRRPPLTDAARRAGWDFRKATERIERIVEDDRFAANKEQVALMLRSHLLYANEAYQRLIQIIGDTTT